MLLSSISLALTRLCQRLGRWSPLALWPDGIATPGMWISPRDLTSQWADYTGTTPVVEPGTVADSSNPVGLALDIRAGAPGTLGPELVVNGDFSSATGWTLQKFGTPPAGDATIAGGVLTLSFTDFANFTSASRAVAGLTAGKCYKVTVSKTGGVYIGLTSGAIAYDITLAAAVSEGYIFAASGDTTLVIISTFGTTVVDSISVREVPGNHMLQSTSVDRPLLSARVNLLTYTEDFSDAVWMKFGCTPTNNYGVAPDGTTTAARLLFSGADVLIAQLLSAAIGTSNSGVWIKGVVGETVLVTVSTIDTPSLFTFTGAWQQYEISHSSNPVDRLVISTYLSATARDVLVWHPQISIGTTALPYQPILTDGSSYSSTGFPIAQLYDGVDDGMATAAFAAGTLINGMDCMIAVRRDSAAATYLISNTGSRGFFEWESGDTNRPDVSAGTPTYYVDGVAVTATKGALFTALTAGAWHILEARGLDLSAWTALEVSSLVSYRLNGPRGDIFLYPSTTSTTDKDAARQWLADYYGVTLP